MLEARVRRIVKKDGLQGCYIVDGKFYKTGLKPLAKRRDKIKLLPLS